MTSKEILTQYYIENFQRMVVNVGLRIGDDEAAKDIVQDAFVNILTRTEKIIPSSVSSLVWTVVGRLVCDYWRKKSPQRDYEQHIINSSSTANTNPLTICSARNIEEWMERGMARLSKPQRVVYRMNVFDGMQVSKISQTLDANYKTVEQRLGLARKTMRSYMSKVVNGL